MLGTTRKRPASSMDDVVRPPPRDCMTTLPLDTGVPSGAQPEPLTPRSSAGANPSTAPNSNARKMVPDGCVIRDDYPPLTRSGGVNRQYVHRSCAHASGAYSSVINCSFGVSIGVLRYISKLGVDASR